MKLNEKQEILLGYVKTKHKNQKRLYTCEDYYFHPLRVALTTQKDIDNLVEIALCHDLFEDTDCTYNDLFHTLIKIGYKIDDSFKICNSVTELTDFYTKSNFPYLNRKNRHLLESYRLKGCTDISLSVKYCDIIDNTLNITLLDRGFAKKYVFEKMFILEINKNINNKYYQRCLAVLDCCEKLLKI